MRKYILAAVMACNMVPLAGCATLAPTAGTIALSADKAFATAQISFHAFQTAILAGIRSGVITGSLKAKLIDLNDKGAALEAKAYATRDSAAIIGLTDIVAQISATGIKAN